MASAYESEEETFSKSETEDSEESDSTQESDSEDDSEAYSKPPCKYYNGGGCKNRGSCTYLHVCRYFLSGNCKYGSNCKLSHNVGGRASSGGGSRFQDQSATPNPKLTNGRYYQWQIHDGRGWKNVKNDHVIEAQYSLPHTKSIKLYNTPYGALSIDFNRIKVYGKDLKVRRLDDGNTVWLWYCTLRRKWIKYGDKDSKGNPGPVKSADIERRFQSNPTSSYTFNVGGETFEIRFKEMRQVGKKKRKVTRRPQFRQQTGNRAAQVISPMSRLSVGCKWEFQGDNGLWHEFKHRSGTSTECSVTSDDIERKYQQNPNDVMTFNVKGQTYTLDFKAKTQINRKTMHTRKIRRV